MDYIVMDLEWNQNPYGKSNYYPDLPFEIIEIVSVRVSEDIEILDSYQQIIRPRVYNKLHYKIREITHFTEEELKEGKDFKRAIIEFLDWCGDDYMFCTWGSMDLTELQKNMKHYRLERVLEMCIRDSYNIDKSSGKIVSLKDIFKEKSDYIKIISNDIKRQMKQQMLTKDVVYFIKDNGISTGFKEISGNQNYYINNEGNIVIAFDEYEVGPVSYTHLRSLFKS